MISSFRNFAKTKFAGLLVFIMIIPFVFWGMGSMFSSGNTNNIAKINNKNISTKEFIDYVNNSGIPQKYIKENLNKNIVQELLSGLISATLLDLEIENFKIKYSKNSLFKKIKTNKNFLDEDGNFQRIKYEKFLLENNQSAAGFEQNLKKRELQKNLFNYIGAGMETPIFLTKKLFKEENKKLNIEFINLDNFYIKKEEVTQKKIMNFIENNDENLKVEYLDFSYAILSPNTLVGVDEFNQTFFDKIDQIEIDISNDVTFKKIVSSLDIQEIIINNFKFSSDKNEIEKKIFELRNNKIDIFDNGENYILYTINNIEKRKPDINDPQTKKEITNLIIQKDKFDYNQKLLKEINDKKFDNILFEKMGQNKIEKIKINSIRDNKKFAINAVELLYTLPINSFTLINDDKDNIYLVKIINFENEPIKTNNDNFKSYIDKQNLNNKNSILRSYDLFLNDRYNVELNQKTIERVKNYFQ